MKSLQDLDIFVRTADSGSLSATARALDLTPAAASAALKRLEAELGVTLFVRSTRSLRLTQEGELFLEHCRPALAGLRQVRDQLAGGQAALRGTLQLAAPPTWAATCSCPGWTSSRASTQAWICACTCPTALPMSTASLWTRPFAMAGRRIPAWWPCRCRTRTAACSAPRLPICSSVAPRQRPTTWPDMTACASCWARKCTTAGASGRQGRGCRTRARPCPRAAAMWPMTEMPCGAGPWPGGDCLQVVFRRGRGPGPGPPSCAVHRLDDRVRAPVPGRPQPQAVHAAGACVAGFCGGEAGRARGGPALRHHEACVPSSTGPCTWCSAQTCRESTWVSITSAAFSAVSRPYQTPSG